VYPSLHHKNGLTFQLADDKLAGVTVDRRNRPVWQIPVWDRHRLLNGISQAVEARA
jgi:hypothetical protein